MRTAASPSRGVTAFRPAARPLRARLGRCLAACLGIISLAHLGAQPTALVVPALEVQPEGIDAGEVLLGELNCVACHVATLAVRNRLLPKPAPWLEAVAGRARPAYLRRFLLAPHQEKAGTPMPDVLHGLPEAERAATAEALAHFLASLTHAPDPEPASTNRLLLEQGRILYHRTGCVACHAPQEPAARLFPEATGGGPTDAEATRYVLNRLDQTSVPLGNVRAKYFGAGLAKMLLDPLVARPSGRMPSLNLTEAEAKAIAAYLQREPAAPPIAAAAHETPQAVSPGEVASAAPFVVDPVRAKRGRERFAALGCAACHELGAGQPRIPNRLPATAFAELKADAPAGCLATAPAPGVPQFLFNEPQRAALRSILARRESLAQPLPPRQQAARRMMAFNCYACHSRDGFGGPGPSRADYFVVITGTDLGDEGRIPPHLSEVGNKLRPEWLREVLLSHGVVRPYMATRMPQFGATNGEPFVTAFLEADLPAGAPPVAGPTTGDLAAGRRLAGVGGYACISCHTFGPYRSLGISVMDMTQMAKRLRYDWFHRYVIEPSSLRPGTRMPSFWPEGQPSLKDILDGNTERQIEALWAYLSQGSKAEPPPGLTEAKPPAAP